MPEQVRSKAPPPHHRLQIEAHLGVLQLHIAAEFHAPWTVLFGPSGSGKSTLLRVMAGLLPSFSSTSVLFERRQPPGVWTTLAGATHSLPPERRSIAYAPQSPSLFPHLSVGENVGFGALVAAISSSSLLPALLLEAQELFELGPLWRRRPAELSGGEQQRVNLARAFARPGARLLLLDEPFTGLDRPSRDRLLPRLRSALTGRNLPVVSVTHDIEEAFLLGADILRLSAGSVLAQGSAAEVLADEREEILRTLRSL